MNVKGTYEELNAVVQSCVKATNEFVYIYAIRLCRRVFWNVNIAMFFLIHETYWRLERVKHTMLKNMFMKIMFLYYTIFYSVEIFVFCSEPISKMIYTTSSSKYFLMFIKLFLQRNKCIYIQYTYVSLYTVALSFPLYHACLEISEARTSRQLLVEASAPGCEKVHGEQKPLQKPQSSKCLLRRSFG